MSTVTIEEAQAHLPDLIGNLTVGQEIVITQGKVPVAKLVSQRLVAQKRPGPGLCKGMLTIVADDEEHLKDFAEYMP